MKVLLEDKNKVVEIPDGLSPEKAEVELRKFYTPEELYGSTTFEEREGYRVRKGRTMVDDGNLWYKAMVGDIGLDEANTKTKELNAEFTQENDEKYQAHNWPERFAGATTELAPYMLDSAIQGTLYGEGMGAIAASMAAVAGQAGPQAVLPEEMVTVPAAYIGGRAVGQAWGTWMNAARVEGGQVYKSLIQDGIDPKTASNFAAPAGYLIGAIELLQIERLLPGYGRAGITNLIKTAAKKGGSKAASTLTKFSAQLTKNLAATTAIETTQELTQELISITAEVGASIYEDMATEEGYTGPEAEDVKNRLSDTLISSLLGFPLLGLPGSVHSTVSLHGKDKFSERVITKKAQKALNLELTEFIEQASEAEDFQQFHESLGEEIDDKFVNKFGFDNRTLFEETIWNQSRNLQGEHIYEENVRLQKESDGPIEPILEGFRSVQKSISRVAEPISTRLKSINPKLKNKMRRYEFDLKQRVLQDEKSIKPFLEGFKKLSDKDKADLDLALKNNDQSKIEDVLKRNNLEAEFESVRQSLNAAHERAVKTGINLGFIEDYFPRQVKDVEGMMKFFKKQDKWPEMQKAMKEKEEKLGRKMTDEEKAEMLNSMLKGFKGRAKPGNIKTREISSVTPQLNQFYQDSPQALLNYIYRVNDYIEARRFFGKSNAAKVDAVQTSLLGSTITEKTLEESIGNFVLDLLQSGDIKGSDAKDLEEILGARFAQKGPGKMTSMIKNISYLETMGSVTSAITQIGDIAFSLYKNGFYKTGKALSKAVVNQSEISKEDIGIEKIAEEFSDKSKSAKAVDKVFKMVGLSWMDRLGKETQINAAFDKFSGLAQKVTISEINQSFDEIDTRGEKVFYHGTSSEINKLSDLAYTTLNYFGQGFYTTEALDIAKGYSKKGRGSTPSIYETKEKKPVKLFDMETTLSDELKNKIKPSFFDYSEILGESKNLREAINELRDAMTSDYQSADTVQEYFDAVRSILEKEGYRGYSHVGGANTKNKPHNVRIYWFPEQDIEISKKDTSKPARKIERIEKDNPFYKKMQAVFGEEAVQVIKDLKNKTPSENVKFLLFSELADVQPIAISEMPEYYLRLRNGRIFYMLKTYTIKQIDVFRNETIIGMKDKPVQAIGNFIKLASVLILANATADIIKDFILGRPLESEDEEGNDDYLWIKFVDNLIRLSGLSKYSLYRFKKDSVSEGVGSIVIPPIFNFVQRGLKDIDKARNDDEFELHQTEIIQSVPMLGKLYYWWFGGGRKKIEDSE